jgi:hypothetical protein
MTTLVHDESIENETAWVPKIWDRRVSSWKENLPNGINLASGLYKVVYVEWENVWVTRINDGLPSNGQISLPIETFLALPREWEKGNNLLGKFKAMANKIF